MQKTSLFSSPSKTWGYIWEVTPNTGAGLIRRVTDLNQLSTDDCFRIAYDLGMDSIFKIGEHSDLSSIPMFTGNDAIFVFQKNSDIGVAHYVWDDLDDKTSLSRAKTLYKELKSLESTHDIYCFKVTGHTQGVAEAFEDQAKVWRYHKVLELMQADITQVHEACQAQLRNRTWDIDHDIKLCQNLIELGGHLPTRNACEFLKNTSGFYCQIGDAEKITLILSALNEAKCTTEIPIDFEWECTAHDFVCHVILNQNFTSLVKQLEVLRAYKSSIPK